MLRALGLNRQAGDIVGQARTHSVLAHMAAQRGRYRDSFGHHANEPCAGDRFGLAHHGLGDHTRRRACDILSEPDHAKAEDVRAKLARLATR
jgi:hypothetical protein